MHSSLDEEFQLIIRGCCKSDRSSQNSLYRKFYPYGMSVCIRYVKNESEAVLVLNDGFLKVFRNIKKFDVEQPFKPWFRKILVNSAINYLKSQKKYRQEVDLENAINVSSTEEILSQINYKEQMKLIQSLTSAYRTVFNMYVIDGYKHKEISEKLGITVSTSKSNLTRARMKLKELMTQKLENVHG